MRVRFSFLCHIIQTTREGAWEFRLRTLVLVLSLIQINHTKSISMKTYWYTKLIPQYANIEASKKNQLNVKDRMKKRSCGRRSKCHLILRTKKNQQQISLQSNQTRSIILVWWVMKSRLIVSKTMIRLVSLTFSLRPTFNMKLLLILINKEKIVLTNLPISLRMTLNSRPIYSSVNSMKTLISEMRFDQTQSLITMRINQKLKKCSSLRIRLKSYGHVRIKWIKRFNS